MADLLGLVVFLGSKLAPAKISSFEPFAVEGNEAFWLEAEHTLSNALILYFQRLGSILNLEKGFGWA
jgi:hypothetical protein